MTEQREIITTYINRRGRQYRHIRVQVVHEEAGLFTGGTPTSPPQRRMFVRDKRYGPVPVLFCDPVELQQWIDQVSGQRSPDPTSAPVARPAPPATQQPEEQLRR